MTKKKDAEPLIDTRERARLFTVPDMALVDWVANRAFSRHRNRPHWEDLLSVGIIGLVVARRNYNPKKAKFSTFASRVIWSHMYRFVGNLPKPQANIEDMDEPSSASLPIEEMYDAHRVLNLIPSDQSFLLRRRFGIGCRRETLVQIGEKMNLSKEWIRQLELKALASCAEFFEQEAPATKRHNT